MEDKDMSGVLFISEDRNTDKHPNMTGNVVIKGEKYYLSAWSNVSKAGKKYLKLSVNAEQKQKQQTTNDDLPF